MRLNSIKPILAVLWICAAVILGIAADVSSLSGWTVVAVLAVVPPLVMLWQWNEPRQTMSESIHEARQ